MSFQQTIFANTKTQKATGNDNQFQLKLSTRVYKGNRIRLSSFIMTNLISNMTDGRNRFCDFSLNIDGVDYTIIIQQIHLNLTQLFDYINQQIAPEIIEYTDNNGLLTVNSAVNWFPIGQSWETKLGLTLDAIPQQERTATKYYNISQTNVLYIRINEVGSQFDDQGLSTSFMIQNTSAFGQKLVLTQDLLNNQQVILGSQTQFQNLNVSLYDDFYQPIQTQNNNNTGINIVFTLILYDDDYHKE